MPFPEPGSWDRKEIYRERRPVKSEPLESYPVSSRWRDSTSFSYRGNHHGSGPREFSRRGFMDYGRPPGRGRQQSDWHMFPDESGNGYMPSRSCERVVEDRGYWTSSSSRADGSYRGGTDYYKVRGYQKDWEGPYWQQSNSSTAISGGRSPVFYEGKSCNGFPDMPVERKHNGMYPGFGVNRHFNESSVVSNGRQSIGFSGASIEKLCNGISPRNGYSPINGFSPRNVSEGPFSLPPAHLGDEQCIGYSNVSIDNKRNGLSGHSVVKTHNRVTPSVATERHINMSTGISGDRASAGISPPPGVNASNKHSPRIAAGRSDQISPDIVKPACAFISSNTSIEKSHDGLSPSVSAERPINLPSSLSRDKLNLGLPGALVEKTRNNISSSLADGDMTRISVVDALATNICDGIARSTGTVTVLPLANNDGKLSNIEDVPNYMRTNSECPNKRPENPLKQQPDIELGEINESFDSPRHDNEIFLGTGQKPLIWTRSGSLSSHGHCTSSISISIDSKAPVDESLQIKGTTLYSPTGNAADCLASSATSGEAHTSKRARLGWGQGLAKYEKKVVDDPRNGKQIEECSPKVGDNRALTTSASATCVPSPDIKCKSLMEENLSDYFKQCDSEVVPSSFQNLDLSIVMNKVYLLLNTIHSYNQCPTGLGSGPESSSDMSKLLLWKTGILKSVETIDSEIESLESEIQSLESVSRSNIHCPAASSSLYVNGVGNNRNRTACNASAMPTPLQVDSSLVRDDIDSPGTATSNPMVPSLKVKKTLQVGNACQDSSANSSHMMGKLTHTCDVDTSENHDKLKIQGSRICEFIYAANKEVASRASDEIARLLVKNGSSVPICPESTNDFLIRDEVAKRKKLHRFTERVVTLKYIALQQLWKEDAQLLEIRKNRSKSSKLLDLGTRTSQYPQLKSNLLRSRVASSEGSTKLVPSSQTVSLTSNWLSEFPVKVYKDELKMPPLILDEKEKEMSWFVSYNSLVEDPVAVEKERAVLNPWTADEKEIFLDKFALYGKDFRNIASHLDHKTTADCVEFYYKNHKSMLFERTRKKSVRLGTQSKQVAKAAYMLTSGDKWNQECAAADVLARISGSISSEAYSSCVSSSFNHADVHHQWKRKKVGSKRKQREVFTPNNDEICSGESSGEMIYSALDWTDEEKHMLLEAVKQCGNNFELVSKFVKTRNSNECKAFYSKVKKRLGSTQTTTTAGIRLDNKPEIDVRLATPLLEPVL